MSTNNSPNVKRIVKTKAEEKPLTEEKTKIDFNDTSPLEDISENLVKCQLPDCDRPAREPYKGCSFYHSRLIDIDPSKRFCSEPECKSYTSLSSKGVVKKYCNRHFNPNKKMINKNSDSTKNSKINDNSKDLKVNNSNIMINLIETQHKQIELLIEQLKLSKQTN
jgi:hypothetical protein